MPLLEAPTNFDDESSPENSLAANVPPAAQLHIHAPEPRRMANLPDGVAGVDNTFGGYRLPTIRLHTERTYAEAQAAAAAESTATARTATTTTTARTTPPARGRRAADIFAELEAEAQHNAQAWRSGNGPPPVLNLLPVTLPRQVAEPQLDELLRRVTQRNDLQNVSTVRLRVISAITVSLSRLAMFLPRLQHLDLSGSVLCSLRDLGCGLIHLNHLNVSNCGLNSFDGTSGMPSVRVLIADGNMIQRVGPLAQLPLLQRLSAQNNRISDLSLLTFLAMCPNLLEVELQGNPVCHLRLYRHTLQRNVRTLRRIDGLPVIEEATPPPTTATTPPTSLATPAATTTAPTIHDGGNFHVAEIELNIGSDVEHRTEAARVAALNRRNALLCRASSTTSSSSVSTSSSIANTASDNEALSSLSSDGNQAPNDDNNAEEAHTQQQQQQQEIYYDDTLPFTPPTLARRRMRRPATAPTAETDAAEELGVANDDVFFDRPASASTVPSGQLQHIMSPTRGAASAAIMAGSVLDLVRQRRRPPRNRRRGLAWMSESVESTTSASSASASSLAEIPVQQLIDSNSSSELMLNNSLNPEG